MTTSYHISHGLTSKTLTKTAKNTHTSIQYTTQTDNGHQSLKLKELSLSRTTGFTEYNSYYDKLLLVQYMSLRAPLTQKFMLTSTNNYKTTHSILGTHALCCFQQGQFHFRLIHRKQ